MIKRQSHIAILVSMFLLMLAGGVAIWSFLAIHRTSERLGEISELERSVSALKDIAGEFDHRFDPRFVHQWDAIEVKAATLVDSLAVSGRFDAGVRSEIGRRLEQMTGFFHRLRASAGDAVASRETEVYFRGRINSNADAIIGRVVKDKRILRSEQSAAEVATFSALLCCIIIAAANIWLFYGLIIRPILSAFEALREEADRIGRGDLQAPVLAPRGGEIGLLFRSLDSMRAALHNLTKDLEVKRVDAEAAARAKTEFLANMSHELRTPLNAVIGFAELLQDLDGKHAVPDKYRSYTQGIAGSGRHLLALINDVLDFAKIDSDKFSISYEQFNFHSEIENIKSAFHGKAAESNVTLIVDAKNAPHLIKSDQIRVRQVLYNLIGNAVKFTNDGVVRVSFTVEKLGGRRVMLSLFVEDDGIGIGPDRLAKIFNPFDQADNSISRRFGGTGLGLPITKNIVEALGGEISVTSSLGKGSRFVASIEIEDDSDQPSLSLQGGADVSEDKTESYDFHVLVADDVMINREVVSELLMRFGCTVDSVANGAEAVEKARGGTYDFVMLDVHMPVMDGVEAARRIRALDAERDEPMRIFAWTADVLQSGVLKIGPGEWNGVVLKPVSKKDLEVVLTMVEQDKYAKSGARRRAI